MAYDGMELTAAERKAFKDLAMAARVAATRYDGSRAKLNHLAATFRDIKAFIDKPRFHNLPEADRLERFARQCNVAYEEGFSFPVLRQRAFASFCGPVPLQKPSGTRHILETLKTLGVAFEYAPGPLIEAQASQKDFTCEPRLAFLLAALLERDVAAEEIDILTGPPGSGLADYIVIDIPSLAHQVALSHKQECPSYLYNGDTPPEFWNRALPETLMDDPRVTPLHDATAPDMYQSLQKNLSPSALSHFTRASGAVIERLRLISPNVPANLRMPDADRDEMFRRLAEFSRNREKFMVQAADERAHASLARLRTLPPTEQEKQERRRREILLDALGYAVKNQCFPPCAWKTDKRSVRDSWRSHAKWLDEYDGITVATFIDNWIRQKASEYRDDHDGVLPDEKSGLIENTGRNRIEWTLLAQCYEAYTGAMTTTLDIVLREYEPGHNERVAAEKERRGIADNLASALLNPLGVVDLLADNPEMEDEGVQRLPVARKSLSTEDVPPQPGSAVLPENPPAVSLPDEGFDERVIRDMVAFVDRHDVLPDISMERYDDQTKERWKNNYRGLWARHGRQIDGFVLQWLRDMVDEYKAQHNGRSPDENSGEIGDYGISWARMDALLKKSGYRCKSLKKALGSAESEIAQTVIDNVGLSNADELQEELPPAATGPAAKKKVPEASGKVAESGLAGRRESDDQYLANLQKEIVSYALKHKAWPSQKTDNTWTKHNLWLYKHRESSIPHFINGIVNEWAQTYKKSTGNMPSRLSGVIAAMPCLTWEMVDDCYTRKSSRTENLEIILNLDLPGHEERVAAEKARRKGSSDEADIAHPETRRFSAPSRGYVELATPNDELKGDFSDGNSSYIYTSKHKRRTRQVYDTDKRKLIPEKIEERKTIILRDLISHIKKHDSFPSWERSTTSPEDKALWRRHERWLWNQGNLLIGSFTREWLYAQADSYRESHDGQFPDVDSGMIEGHDISWESMDRALKSVKNAVYSLEIVLKRSLPGHEERVTAERVRRMALKDKIVSYALQNSAWPSGHSTPEWRSHDSQLRLKGSSLRVIIQNMVTEWAEEYRARTGEYPTRASGTVKSCPAMTWENIDDFYTRKSSRTENLEIIIRAGHPGHEERVAAEQRRRKSLLPAVQGDLKKFASTSASQDAAVLPETISLVLDSLKTARRFPVYLPDGTLGSAVGNPWIVDRIADYRKNHDGKNPTAQSGMVDRYPGHDWSMIDEAIFAQGRRVKIRLDRFIEKHTPVKTVREKPMLSTSGKPAGAIKEAFTRSAADEREQGREAVIVADFLAYAAKHDRFPSTGRSDDTPEEKRLWGKHEKWLNKHTGSGISSFIRNWTRGQNRKYQAAHGGTHAHAHAGDIEGYPGYDWKLIDTCYRGYKKQFTTTLSHVLLESDTKQGENQSTRRIPHPRPAFARQTFDTVLDIPEEKRWSGKYKYTPPTEAPSSRNDLAARVLAFAQIKNKFPSANDKTESYKTRAYWRIQEEWCLNHEKMTLSRFILSWTRERAAEHRRDHDGQQPSTGPIKGFEGHTWDLLRTCYRAQPLQPGLEEIVACDPDGYRLAGEISSGFAASAEEVRSAPAGPVRMEGPPPQKQKARQAPGGWKPRRTPKS